MREELLKYLTEFGSVTTFQAFRELGMTRLSEYIRQLRMEYEITDEWVSRKNRYGREVHFKQYFLGEKYE